MALLITRFAGAQAPYLCEVDSTSTGFVTTGGVGRGNQLYSYLMDASGDAIDFNVTTNTYCIYIGFAIRFATSVPTSTTIGYYDDTSGNIACELWMNSSGQLEFREGDGGSSTVLATSSALSANTWYYVEIAFENRASAGDWYYYIDDVEIGSGSGDGNFSNSGATTRWRFFQGASYNRYLTDIYCGYDSAATVDSAQRLGKDTKVVYYWSTANTATSSSGVDLDIGTWSACCSDTLSPSVAAEVTGTGNARRLLDEGTDGTYTGPYDQFGSLDDIKGYKVTCMAERGGGGGSNHYIDLGGTSSYNLSQVVSLNTSATFVEAYYNAGDPGIGTGAIGVGFGTDGGQDFECYNIQAAVLYGPGPSATPRNVTCTTEALSMTESAATVTTGTPLNVTGTTEVLTFTESASTVQKNQYRLIAANPGATKHWKGLTDNVLTFYGSSSSASENSPSQEPDNMLDGDTGTWTLVGNGNYMYGIGLSEAWPTQSTSSKPIRIEVRVYATVNTVNLYAGWDYGNQQYGGPSSKNYWQQQNIYTGNPGGWSPWAELTLGYNWWGDEGQTNYTEPLTWAMIRDHLTIGVYAGNSTARVHAIEVRITEGEADVTVGYFDGSVGENDNLNAWSNEANVKDGNTSTWATCTDTSSTLNWLEIGGNTITQGSAEDEIYQVYVRYNLRFSFNGGTPSTGASVWLGDRGNSAGPSNDLYLLEWGSGDTYITSDTHVSPGVAVWAVSTSNQAFWTPWYAVDWDSSPNGDIMKNWTEIPQFWGGEIRPASSSDGGLDVSRMEIAVVSAPTNTNRRGGRAKKNRGALGDTQALLLTESAAAIKIDRGVNCTTSAVEWDGTNYPATVSFATNRIVTGITQDLAWDGTNHNATVNTTRTVVQNPAQPGDLTTFTFTESAATVSTATHRTVTCLTESLTLPGTLSTINASRVTSSVTEVLSSTSAGTNVDTARGVAGVSQVLLLAEQQGTALTDRGVLGLTEVVTFVESAANAATSRHALGITEALSMAESQASISTTSNLDVNCTTEVISFTETPAAVNGTRIAAATAEITAFVENASAVNAERFVTATTETLALTDNDSTVARDRAFATSTEVISLAEGTAGVDRQRGVNAGTEALSLTESTAAVTRGSNLDVVCSTEAVSFTEAAATLGLDRGVAASTEALSLTEGAASVTRSYLVTGSTEVLNLSENAATIDITANNLDVTCTTEAIAFAESQATVAFPRNVSATTEALTFAEAAAGVNGQRIVGATVELTAMAENAASVNLSRTVTAVTEQLVATESAASVSTTTSRIVNAVTESLVAVSSATSNQTRGVLSSTEVLGLTENPSSIQVVRNVVATTEVLSFAEAAASPNLTRDVVGLSAATLLVESSAQVFRGANLDVTGLTAAMTLLESAATATFPRRVDGTTEALLFTEFPALANFPKLVSALTAPLTFAEAQATISKLPASVQPGSMIWVDPGVEGAIFTDNVVIQRYD